MDGRSRNQMRARVCGAGVVALCALVWVTPIAAQVRIASLEERIAGAAHVVVAEAQSVSASWRQNEHGDRIIVSRVLLQVGETLKGSGARHLWMEVEGGTVDGITLEVSSLPLMREGDRAVFFLNAERDVYRPFQKGQGILSLDEHDVVEGSSLDLSTIRRMSRGGK